MFRFITVLAVAAVGGLAAWKLDLQALFGGIQPTTVALSIMAAAVLVRLNRGMPTLDWKSLDPKGRKKLTLKIVELQHEYLSILAISTIIIGVLIYLTIVTPQATGHWPNWVQRLISGVLSGGVVLIVARMALVVWRDYDIVRLQKVLIDASGDAEFQNAQEAEAQKTVAAMKGKLAVVEKPKISDWK